MKKRKREIWEEFAIELERCRVADRTKYWNVGMKLNGGSKVYPKC